MSAVRIASRALRALPLTSNSLSAPGIQTRSSRRVLASVARQATRSYSAAASSTSTSSVKPSFLRRAATYVGTGFLCYAVGLIMTVAPALPASGGFLTPPSDAETLTMFTPETPKAIEVSEYIEKHWLTREMRAKGASFTELRPHLKIPPQFRDNNLTAGVLLGEDRVPAPPVAWVEEGGRSLVSISYLGPALCGHPGIVHGGFLATMLDEGMARCSFGALPHNIGMTANLNINYRAPARTDSYVVLRAETTSVEGRKANVTARIETLPEKEGDEPVVLVEATALFVSPKNAAMMKTIYPV